MAVARPDPVARCLVVGLGNPGPEYVGTRHNVGFEVLDVLARRWKAAFEPNKLVQGLVATAFPPGLPTDRVRLVKPMTYMNLCGPAYQKALKVFEAEVAGALVVVDDFMMEFGRIRLRADGSSGGHNGLKSIEGAVGAGYPRLKVGIGTPPAGRDPADFVLSRYAAVERKELPFVLEEAADAVVTWLALGMDRAMERHNRKKDA
jgi:PTH1 family peptidyl-tRNA hydrolase